MTFRSDSMTDEVLCSFLLPTRGTPHLTLKSLKSIIQYSSDTIPYEVLIAIDSDDKDNLAKKDAIFSIVDNPINDPVIDIVKQDTSWYNNEFTKDKFLI